MPEEEQQDPTDPTEPEPVEEVPDIKVRTVRHGVGDDDPMNEMFEQLREQMQDAMEHAVDVATHMNKRLRTRVVAVSKKDVIEAGEKGVTMQGDPAEIFDEDGDHFFLFFVDVEGTDDDPRQRKPRRRGTPHA